MPVMIDAAVDQNDFVIEAELDGKVYFLALSWNSECEIWTLTVEDANSATISAGIGVVPNSPLLAAVRREAMPPGELVVGTDSDSVVRDSFITGRAILAYVSATEIAALQAT